MAIWRRLESWLSWFPWYRRQARDADLARELRDHLDLEADEQRAAGLSPEEAAYAAHRALGNTLMIEEDVRAARGFQWLESCVQDVRYAFRTLRKSSGFTTVAVLTLAIGIGANTAIFSLVRGVLLRGLPFRDASRILLIQETTGDGGRNPVSYPNYLDWKTQSRSFEEMAAYSDAEFIVSGPDKAERIYGEEITDTYFPLLGVEPALGRALLPEENQEPLARPVAMISYGLWQRLYGADPQIIGKKIRLNNFDYTIVGVAPRGFTGFTDSAEAWIPFMMRDAAWPEVAKFDFLHSRDVHWIKVLGRLKPCATVQSATAEMNTIAANLRKAFPRENTERGVLLRPIAERLVGSFRTPLLVLMGAVALVLVIACANVINLLLTRSVARNREIAMRLSLGATRARLLRQLVTESVLLSLLGAGAGIVLASWGSGALLRVMPLEFPSFVSVRVDREVLLACCALALFTGVLLGLLPALSATRTGLAESLKEGTKGSIGVRGRKMGRVLVGAEVAVCLVLLIGAGLLLQSVRRMLTTDSGFKPDHLVTLRFYVPARHFEGDSKNRFGPRLAEEMAQVPGVQSAAVSFIDPFIWSGFSRGFTLKGHSPLSAAEIDEVTYQEIGPNFFGTMGIPVKTGRDFTAHDDLRSPGRVMVNEAFARRYWPGESALGKRLKYGPIDSHYSWMEVIGVVGDSKFESLRQDADASPVLYGALLQSEVIMNMSLLVRTKDDPAAMIGPLRSAIQRFDPEIPVYNVATVDERMRATAAETRSYATLLALFAGLALVLAVVGIYGVISYWVTQRTQEMGIRMALGAHSRDVLRLVVWQGMGLMVVGVATGVGCALIVTRALKSMLFGVTAADPPTYILLAAILLLAGGLAAYVPARRATRIDPLLALRYE